MLPSAELKHFTQGLLRSARASCAPSSLVHTKDINYLVGGGETQLTAVFNKLGNGTMPNVFVLTVGNKLLCVSKVVKNGHFTQCNSVT